MAQFIAHLVRSSLALALIALALVAGSGQANAVVELNITQGKIQPLPIAIPDFTGDGSIDPQEARAISDVVAADLSSSGLFNPIDQAAFIEKQTNFDDVPRFDDWRVVNAQALVVGRIGASDGKLKAEFRLWDVLSGKQLAGEQFFARAKDARRVGHIIADAIYERITGEKGYFDTRIVFVDESGPKDKRTKRLAIMDQDGFNVRLLTTGQNLVIDGGLSIVYLFFKNISPKPPYPSDLAIWIAIGWAVAGILGMIGLMIFKPGQLSEAAEIIGEGDTPEERGLLEA